MATPPPRRGTEAQPAPRYAATQVDPFDDGWPRTQAPAPRTTLGVDSAREVISYNQSPDLPFDRSLNPYRGCEHGCIYCYARPTHAWLDLSPGLDFETRLLHKPDAPERLVEALARPGYRCAPIMLGANTDAYQPIERQQRLTRRLIEVLTQHDHPFFIVTKGSLVERDLDLIAPAAAKGQVRVAISLATLDAALARRLEPRAAHPERRLESIRRLSDAGVPVSLMLAPIVPVLSDSEVERVLAAARAAGADGANYVLLRLPLEVEGLFREWLETHYPDSAAHVMQRVRDCREGRTNDARFGSRLLGSGPFAELIAQRFRLACKRLGYQPERPLDATRFHRPVAGGRQLSLF